ncbi:MAG: hypothetical protein U9N42_09485 [Campylobacterota bacterium]|nr:hypothetical protein [Campylobacterota bacterium]
MFKFLAKSALSYTIFKKYGVFILKIFSLLIALIFIFVLYSDVISYLKDYYEASIINNVESELKSYHNYLTYTLLLKWIVVFSILGFIIKSVYTTFLKDEKKLIDEKKPIGKPKEECEGSKERTKSTSNIDEIDEVILKKRKLKTKGDSILDKAQTRKDKK